LAVLILGATNLTETKTETKTRFFGLITKTNEKIIDKKAELSEKLLNCAPVELLTALMRIMLSNNHASDFFYLITFLTEMQTEKSLMRMTKATR
jgi:Leucine-rich repeat (LRR) protein